MRQNGRIRRAVCLAASAAAMLGTTACGGSDEFENKPRPPIPVQLTGVITEEEVTVSPNKVPLPAEPGQAESSAELNTPINLILANQTETPYTITLAGQPRDRNLDRIEVRTPQINPGDTAQIQQTLPPGTYEVRAGSERAVSPDEQIAPATLTVNTNRQTSSDDTLLP